jgi:ankyrin repeat protein
MLLTLPREIILLVAEQACSYRDLNALARCNKTLYSLLNKHLYGFSLAPPPRDILSHALRYAINTCPERTLVRFLDAGVCPSSQIFWPQPITLLSAAVLARREPLVRILLSRGADPNAMPMKRGKVYGEPPIVAATRSGQVDLMIVLMDKGAEVGGAQGAYLLGIAMGHGRAEAVRCLLHYGVDPRSMGVPKAPAQRRIVEEVIAPRMGLVGC